MSAAAAAAACEQHGRWEASLGRLQQNGGHNSSSRLLASVAFYGLIADHICMMSQLELFCCMACLLQV